MKAMTLKGNIDDYLRSIAGGNPRKVAEEELTKFYNHVTGICCLKPTLNDRGGCSNCGDTWRPR